MSRVYVFICCLAILSSGCATHRQSEAARLRDWIAVGSHVKLHQELTIPANHARLFLQRGQVLATGFDRYYPHCNFEIRTLSDEVQKIVPDDFVVTRIQQGFEEVVSLSGPIKVAAVGTASLYGVFGSDLPLVTRFVHLYLESKRQPDVMRLTCHGAFDFTPDAELPTVDEIREALGEIATFEGYPQPGIIQSR